MSRTYCNRNVEPMAAIYPNWARRCPSRAKWAVRIDGMHFFSCDRCLPKLNRMLRLHFPGRTFSRERMRSHRRGR